MKLKKEKITEVRAELADRCQQDVAECLQCARCSAGCPVVAAMDLLPHQIIRLLQLGDIAGAAESKTPWICAACFTCAARCPRDLDLARIMEGVRLSVLRLRESRGLNPGQVMADLPADELTKIPQQALVGAFRKRIR